MCEVAQGGHFEVACVEEVAVKLVLLVCSGCGGFCRSFYHQGTEVGAILED